MKPVTSSLNSSSAHKITYKLTNSLLERCAERKRFNLSVPVHKARFPSKRNRLRCVRCVNENGKKRKRLRWQAANHGCHCYDRAFLLAGAYATHATQAIAFEWKPGLTVNTGQQCHSRNALAARGSSPVGRRRKSNETKLHCAVNHGKSQFPRQY